MNQLLHGSPVPELLAAALLAVSAWAVYQFHLERLQRQRAEIFRRLLGSE